MSHGHVGKEEFEYVEMWTRSYRGTGTKSIKANLPEPSFYFESEKHPLCLSASKVVIRGPLIEFVIR